MTTTFYDDYQRRAMAAYFRSNPDAAQPTTPTVVQVDGKSYVHLHNSYQTLAVYRVRNDGMLKRLKRWPAELEVR
jgi:hypothetical protein